MYSSVGSIDTFQNLTGTNNNSKPVHAKSKRQKNAGFRLPPSIGHKRADGGGRCVGKEGEGRGGGGRK